VYWVRRLLVLGVACGLVFGVGRVLGGGSEGSPEPSAQPAAATASTTASSGASPTAVSTADATPIPGQTGTAKPGKKQARVRVPLAMPTGPCQDSDVRVVPAMEANAYAGGDVRLTLELSTFASPACDWEVSPDSLAVKLTSGNDRIWSSQDCPAVVPEEPVVLRSRQATLVEITWSGRRSDSDCSRTTQWAEPGYYHVAAAAMGSEPETQQFELLPPAPVTITPSPTPEPKAKDKGREKADEAARENAGESSQDGEGSQQSSDD
jgi:hypothetical protein